MKAATALQLLPKKVESGAEAIKLDGIGKKLSKKIDEILQTGKLQKLEKLKSSPRLAAINLLCRITGIGPVMAMKLVDQHGITTIEQLQKRKDLLNHGQVVGLTYYYEFHKRIPREEVTELEQIALSVLPEIDAKLTATTCGSYRRKRTTCGDIDMLLTHPDYTSDKPKPGFLKKMVAKLKEIDFLKDDLSLGEVQYHGVCKLSKPDAVHRRIDILWIPYDQYFFGLLYFTGSGFFNIQMRRIALEKGFTLNEQEILPIGSNGVCGDPILVESEKDIFDILGMQYKRTS